MRGGKFQKGAMGVTEQLDIGISANLIDESLGGSLMLSMDVMDFFKVVKDESIDLIVADPPYGSRVKWDCKTDEWQLMWLKEAYRVLKVGGSIYVFFAPMNMHVIEGYIREMFCLKNVVVWYHPNLYGAGLSYGRDKYKSTWDVVFYATKGKKVKHYNNVSSIAYQVFGCGFDVMTYPQPRPLLFKAQKPLRLIEQFVVCSSEPGDVVCDPFVGVGTTAIAAVRHGRRFIVNDINKQSILIAKRRINGIGNLLQIDREIWNEINSTRKDNDDKRRR